MWRLLAAALTFFLLNAAPAWSEADSDEELSRVEKELAEQKAEAAALAQKEKATKEEIGKLQDQLIEATTALQNKQNDQEKLESKLQALEEETTKRTASLASARARLTELTGALVRLSRQPPETFLPRAAQTTTHIHRALLLKSLLPRLRAETQHISGELSKLEALRRVTSEQKKLVVAAGQNLEGQQRRLDVLIATRQESLQKTTAEKAVIAKQLASLSTEAKDLKQLLEKASQPQALLHKAPAASSPPDLKMPVAGRITRSYGSKDSYGVTSHGLTLSGAPGGPVVAPLNGRVVFAGSFRGYGEIVIIQHENNNHSFLAGFGRIDVDRGQSVTKGEPLGILPAKGKQRPEIYFEWRHNGEPVNPRV